MEERLGIDQITPEMARAELARREQMRQAASEELARRHPGMQQNEPMQSLSNRIKESLFTPHNPLQEMANSPLMHGIQGAQDSLQELMSLGLAPIKPQGEGKAYNVGKAIGDIGGFVGGGELADLARLGIGATRAGSLPGIKQGLGLLEKSPLIKRLLGATGFGAAADPENRVTGALAGLGLGGLGEAAIAGKELAPKIIESVQPNKHVEEILKTLGKGQSLEENAKSVASDIKTKADELKAIGKENYDRVFTSNNIGSRRISLPSTEKQNKILPQNIVNTFDSKLEGIYNSFVETPTVKNAHDLQSQLGTSIRKLQKMDDRGQLSIADRKIMSKYKDAQKKTKDLLGNTLGEAEAEHNVPYSDLYNKANSYWLNEVIPYQETPAIAQLSKGKIKNPRNLHTIFKNPEENIQKITEDLGNDFKNKILYAELAKNKGNLNSEKFLKNIEELDKKGLSDYLSPEISNQIEALQKKVRNRNIARSAGGIIGGAALGSLAPIPYAKELGGLGGYLAAPHIEKILSAITKKGI